jgi:hypothetical protein
MELNPEVAPRPPLERPQAGGRKDPQKSRITNGSTLLPGVDQRSAWVRRCKDIIAAHISDLGGVDNTSAAERSIVRRAAVLTTELERLEVKFASVGEASTEDLDTYSRVSANLRRLLEAIGLRRRPRDVTPPDPLVYAQHEHAP